MEFYLGTHKPVFLARTSAPLFVSHRRLYRRRSFPRARGPWALDSGAFSEIDRSGCFQTTAQSYAAAVRLYSQEIGNLRFAAIQDWMCEPPMLAKTGLSIREHQLRTIDSYLELTTLEPTLPWVPTLQGWNLSDYEDHFGMWYAAGVQLHTFPTVGLGTVCRRQSTREAVELVEYFTAAGLHLHGFGLKTLGLQQFGHLLSSSDSMAWCMAAWRGKIKTCAGPQATCKNCLHWALEWRNQVLANISVDHDHPTAT